MTHFNWDDPLLLEHQLTRKARIRVRPRLLPKQPAARVLSAFREERFEPKWGWETAVLARPFPQVRGGAGVNHVAYTA